MNGHFARHTEQKIIDLSGGVTRRILSYDSQIMAVEVAFESGSIGAVHSLLHTQCSYVLSGKFQYTIDQETVEMVQSDSIVVPSGAKHSTLCVEKSILLDIFTPVREDFLT